MSVKGALGKYNIIHYFIIKFISILENFYHGTFGILLKLVLQGSGWCQN